jgi:hypothetical protein
MVSILCEHSLGELKYDLDLRIAIILQPPARYLLIIFYSSTIILPVKRSINKWIVDSIEQTIKALINSNTIENY